MKGHECNMKDTLRDMNAKWKGMGGNGRKWEEMGGNGRKWKEIMTSIDFRPRMLSHPQKAGHF